MGILPWDCLRSDIEQLTRVLSGLVCVLVDGVLVVGRLACGFDLVPTRGGIFDRTPGCNGAANRRAAGHGSDRQDLAHLILPTFCLLS